MDKTVLGKYTRTYDVRFSRRQKKCLIEVLHQDFHALGYEPTTIEGKKLLSHMYSYLYGNMKQVKTAIVVPYGTPGRKLWKKALCFPFDGTKTANKITVATYVPISLLFALVFEGLYGLQPLTTSTGLASLISCGLFLLTAMLAHWMIHGFYSVHSYNRNSAAIAAAVEIAKRLNRDGRKKVDFLFTGKNKMCSIGTGAAAKGLANAGKNPTLICLDCIAKGNVVQIGFNPQDHKLTNETVKYHPRKKSIDVIKLNEEVCIQDAMAYFKKAVVIPHGELDDAEGLYVIGTGTGEGHDIELGALDGNVTMVKEYLHNQKQKKERAT